MNNFSFQLLACNKLGLVHIAQEALQCLSKLQTEMHYNVRCVLRIVQLSGQ